MKSNVFSEYPDVVNVDQLREMLGGIGPKAAYKLLHDRKIMYFKIGKAFRIPKQSVIDFLQTQHS
ncbi:helix-turn-helix domain-containing protein [Dysosmobacter sp.]